VIGPGTGYRVAMDIAGHRQRLEVPAGVVVGVVTAAAALAVDHLVQLPMAVSASNARGLLAASFGALVTAGAFAFWMLPVAAQLAAASVPPPAVAGHLEDRFQRRVVAATLGALAYTAVTVLAQPGPADARAPAVATVLGGVLGVAAIAGLLVAIQHAVRSTRPSALISEAAHQVIERIRRADAASALRGPAPDREDPDGLDLDVVAVTAPRTGWLAAVDEDGVLHDLPEGSAVVLEVGVGSFVVRDWTRIATVRHTSLDDGDHAIGQLGRHFTIDDERSAERDLVGSLTQFTDIAVHAGTDGSGAPSIAYEAIWYLGAILHELVHHDLGVIDRRLDDGRSLEWVPDPGAPTLAAMAVDRIRQVTASHPAIALELVRVLADVRRHAALAGRDELMAVLDEQADLTVDQCRHADPLPSDLERVVAMRDEIASGRGTEREEEYPTDPAEPAATR
jgi:uncharacterized membrane protein